MEKTLRKLISMVLAALVTLSLAVPVSAYTDLKGHWAEEYIEKLVERGFLSGYEDGSMKPDKTLTICEALVILSRFYPLDKQAEVWIEYDHGVALDGALGASLAWARPALGICLAAGIVKESEIRKLDLSKAVEKEELTVFIVRALCLTKEATSMASAELSFKDAGQITLSYRGYVSVLAKAGIVSGDESGNFGPHKHVTRAVAAAMISRAIDYLETKGTVLALTDYAGITRAEGFLSAVKDGYLDLRTYAGLVCRYAYSAGAAIYVGSASCAFNADYVGCAVTLFIRDGVVTKLSTDSAGVYTWATGSVTGAYHSEADYASSYINIGGNYYAPTDETVIFFNDKAASFTTVSASDYAVLRLANGRISRMYAYSTPITLEGQISRLSFAATVDLRVTDSAGIEWIFPLRIADLPEILHDGSRITLDRLSVGDAIRVTMSGTSVASISLLDTVEYISGTLSSILTSADGTQWFLTLPGGSSVSFLLEQNPGVYNGGAAITLRDVGIGAEVTVSVAGDRIVKVELLAAAPSETKVYGIALGADSAGLLTILTGGRLVYVETKNAVILSAKTGKAILTANIPENATVSAYGEFTNSNRITAVVLVVE